MITKARSVPLALIGALLLAGCASTTTSGTGSAAGPATAATSATGPSAAGASGATAAPGSSVSPRTLSAQLRDGMRSVTSVHSRISISAAGQDIVATGDQTLADGALRTARLQETVPGFGALTIVVVGRTVYVELPPPYSSPATPWHRVSAASRNPVVHALGAAVGSLLNSSSLSNFGAFAAAARDISVVGPSPVDGVPATEYSLTLDIASLPADFPNRAALQKLGLSTLPMQLWVDGHDRTVRVTEDLTVQGRQITSDIRLSNYDAPVTITAPPATEIATD